MYISKFKTYSVVFLSLWLIGCSNLDDSHVKINEESELIFSATLTDNLGDFKAVNVSGEEMWHFDPNGYAYVSGFVENSNKANEAWLISPEIDLTTVETARLTFDHVVRYFANPATEATLWVSENFVDDQSPAVATWTQLVTEPFTDPGSWTFGTSGEISLTAFAGKKIRIGFKYISTTAKAGSWELKNFLVRRGEAVVVERNWGKGTEAEPYTVAGAIANQTGENWVTGIIVGYVWSGSFTNYVFGSDTCTQATNLLIADTVGTYLSKTMAIQLPVGAVRTGINLKDNKSLLGKRVTLAGSLEAYFGAPGMRNTSYYALENGTSGGTKPVKTIFSESFANNSKGAFTIENVVMPAGVTYIWTTSPSYGMVASAFVGGSNKVTESWLISPEISLANVATVSMTFEHALNYLRGAKAVDFASIWLSTTYTSGSPGSAAWSQLNVPVYPAGTNWTFISSGAVSLDDFAGEPKVRIAFKYVSTTTTAPTWEVKNVVIK
jgi:hypothetical protein